MKSLIASIKQLLWTVSCCHTIDDNEAKYKYREYLQTCNVFYIYLYRYIYIYTCSWSTWETRCVSFKFRHGTRVPSTEPGLVIRRNNWLFETSSFLKVILSNITETNINWKSESVPDVVCLSTQYTMYSEKPMKCLCIYFHSAVLDCKIYKRKFWVFFHYSSFFYVLTATISYPVSV